jgi:osomolarity two-component system, sensor histidine kinase SLN1
MVKLLSFIQKKKIKTTGQECKGSVVINSNKNSKHLICDDAYSNRHVLKKYLNFYGCTVDEAENGCDAINMVKNNGTYNVIWMDIKMPKMDGFVATEILINEMCYNGPIIGLTGYVDEVTIKKCYELGMKHVVSKPFDKKVIQMYCEKY